MKKINIITIYDITMSLMGYAVIALIYVHNYKIMFSSVCYLSFKVWEQQPCKRQALQKKNKINQFVLPIIFIWEKIKCTIHTNIIDYFV